MLFYFVIECFYVVSVSERVALLFRSSAGCFKLFRHLICRFSCVMWKHTPRCCSLFLFSRIVSKL